MILPEPDGRISRRVCVIQFLLFVILKFPGAGQIKMVMYQAQMRLQDLLVFA